MRIMLFLLLAVGAARASEFTRLSAAAAAETGRPAKAAADRAKACRLGWTPDCPKQEKLPPSR
jgi:hypothetical protein